MSQDLYEAIFFYEKGKIAREMLFTEFEAILDSFVPLPEYSGKEVRAIYAVISPQLKVTAAVYFRIGFDRAGNADRKWNLPLRQLAEQAESGPNLGAGPIRLVCKSQCPVSWCIQGMWDPNMSSNPNDFVLLRDVVKRNKLGFKKIKEEIEEREPNPVDVPETPSSALAALLPLNGEEASEADRTLSESLVRFLRQKLSEESNSEKEDLLKQQTLLLAAQKTKFDEEINKLEEQHSEELRSMQEKMEAYHKNILEQKRQNEELQSALTQQSQALENTQALFEKKLAKSKEVDSAQIETLKQSIQQEMQRKLEVLTKEFNNEIAQRDMEIAYRDEEKSSYQNEIEKLISEKSVLISQGGEHFLQRLKENKVSFVVYHHGAGHINIDIDDIGDYLTNPIGYAAKSCKVTEEAYRAWLAHHDDPVCQSFSEIKGEKCGKKLKPVVNPAQFVPGRSDRCPLHWSFAEES